MDFWRLPLDQDAARERIPPGYGLYSDFTDLNLVVHSYICDLDWPDGASLEEAPFLYLMVGVQPPEDNETAIEDWYPLAFFAEEPALVDRFQTLGLNVQQASIDITKTAMHQEVTVENEEHEFMVRQPFAETNDSGPFHVQGHLHSEMDEVIHRLNVEGHYMRLDMLNPGEAESTRGVLHEFSAPTEGRITGVGGITDFNGMITVLDE